MSSLSGTNITSLPGSLNWIFLLDQMGSILITIRAVQHAIADAFSCFFFFAPLLYLLLSLKGYLIILIYIIQYRDIHILSLSKYLHQYVLYFLFISKLKQICSPSRKKHISHVKDFVYLTQYFYISHVPSGYVNKKEHAIEKAREKWRESL